MRDTPDFSVVVRTIGTFGYSQRAIAKRVGVAHTTVNAWANGIATPRYGAGASLLFFLDEVQDVQTSKKRST